MQTVQRQCNRSPQDTGTIRAAPAVMNALVDALRRAYGIGHIDMPATPRRIWETIQAARH